VARKGWTASGELQVVEDGLASVAKTGAQLHSPWLHHVKGELLVGFDTADLKDAKSLLDELSV
jgi:hypothetical protein